MCSRSWVPELQYALEWSSNQRSQTLFWLYKKHNPLVKHIFSQTLISLEQHGEYCGNFDVGFQRQGLLQSSASSNALWWTRWGMLRTVAEVRPYAKQILRLSLLGTIWTGIVVLFCEHNRACCLSCGPTLIRFDAPDGHNVLEDIPSRRGVDQSKVGTISHYGWDILL